MPLLTPAMHDSHANTHAHLISHGLSVTFGLRRYALASAPAPEICCVLVHMQDRLPTPFGLVRSGVAPDHQDTKVGCTLPPCTLTIPDPTPRHIPWQADRGSYL